MAIAERDITSRMLPSSDRSSGVLKVGCTQCTRAAAVQVGGDIVVKNEHGGRTHENRIPVMDLMKTAIVGADAADAVEVLRLAASRLRSLGIDVGFA